MEVPADIKQQQLQEIQKIEEFKQIPTDTWQKSTEGTKENVELSLSENTMIFLMMHNREENSNIDKNIGLIVMELKLFRLNI